MSFKPVRLALNEGGTNANLTASNGGIIYSTATGFAVLASTSTANQPLLSGASGAPGWSTATYPGSTTINRILYSSANNVIGQITTANNGTLVTDSSGVPTILVGPGTTGNILQSNAAAAPSYSTATYPSTVTVSQILYGSASNVVGGITTANSSLLKTSSGGVPSMTTTGSVTETNGQFNWPLQPAFRATMSADPTNVTGAGLAYTLACNTEAFDQNADYDNTTFTFTAPVTGIYHFTVFIFMYGIVAATTIDLALTTSAGTNICQLCRTSAVALSSGGNYGNSWSSTISVAAAGTVKVVLTVSGEAGNVVDILSGAAQTSFSGYLVA